MALWRRPRETAPPEVVAAEVAPLPVSLDAAELELPSLPSPEDFVCSQAVKLGETRRRWGSVMNMLKDFRSDDFREAVHDNVVRFIGSLPGEHGQQPDEENSRRSSNTLLDELSIVWLVGARYISGANLPFKDRIHELRGFGLGMPDPTVRTIAQGLPKRIKAKVGVKLANAADNMQNADYAGGQVIKNFLATYGNAPEGVEQFAELYQEGAADIDTDFQELKHIIVTDWHHFDPARSRLRTHLQYLKEHPELHIDAFGREVATNQTVHALRRLRAMAGFAIIANGVEPVTEAAIMQRIAGSYDRWGDMAHLEDIDVAFQGFISSRVAAIEASLNAIAGQPDQRDIRLHRSEKTAGLYYATLTLRKPETRDERRRNTKLRNRITGADNVPSSASIEAALEKAEAVPLDRKLVGVQRLLGGQTKTTPLSLEDVTEFFNIESGTTLARDVRNMVDYLRKSHRTSGMQGLKPMKRVTQRIGGKDEKLWRFAPNDCPGLQVDPSSQYWRIVFNPRGDELLLVDIVDHPTFDRLYSTSSRVGR